MNERDQDKLKVKEAIHTLKGKELATVWVSYFKKYHCTQKVEKVEKPVLEVFDGQMF